MNRTVIHYFEVGHRSKVWEHRSMVELHCSPAEARKRYRDQRRHGVSVTDARTDMLACWAVPFFYRTKP